MSSYIGSQLKRIWGDEAVDSDDYSQFKIQISGPGGTTHHLNVSVVTVHLISFGLIEDEARRNSD